MSALPNRSKRYLVGKEIGGAIYVHRQYEDRLGAIVAAAKRYLPADVDYVVVKLNERTHAVSFIQCVDFDTADEPTVGDVVTVDEEGNVRRRSQPSDPEIYHHKWLFVGDEYDGFDVQQSKERSRQWMSLNDIDRRRIGKKNYWAENVLPKIQGRS